MTLLCVNGHVLTMDRARPRAEALLVEGERLREVGTTRDVRAAAPAGVTVVDLRGKTVVPGFNDAHCHILMFGMNLSQVDLKSPQVASIVDLRARVAERVARTAPGSWVRGFGYDQTKLAECRHPTRVDLDQVAPHHPVLMAHTSGHMLVANSAALAAAGIDRTTPDPPGGRIVRDERGEPTGLLQETAQQLTRDAAPVPTRAEMVDALRLASAQLAREGITSFQDAHVGSLSPDELSAWQVASESGALKQRVSLILGVQHVYPGGRPAQPPFGLGLRSGFGNDRLRVGGLKIFSDGSLIGRTAALSRPFEGNGSNQGFLTVAEDDLRAVVGDAHRRGWQLSIHAIGDRAISTVLDAYDGALQAYPRADHRHRIEHAGVLTPALIERMAGLRVIPVSQPRFISELGDGFLASLGRERAQFCYPLASLLARGIPVVGSSDRPVVEGAPLLGIHDAVNELTGTLQPYAPAEAIPPEDAIRLFTTHGAYASFEEDRKGTLTPGKLADFVVLGADPTAVPAREIAQVPVVATFVGGEVIFEDGL